MADPSSLREALLAETLGEVDRLIRKVEALLPALDTACQAVSAADAHLQNNLASFEGRMAAISENAKTKTVHQLAARVDEAARRSIDQQSRAMADAARVAMGSEFGATLRRLASVQQSVKPAPPSWELWLTHAAAAVVASALSLAAAVWLWVG